MISTVGTFGLVIGGFIFKPLQGQLLECGRCHGIHAFPARKSAETRKIRCRGTKGIYEKT